MTASNYSKAMKKVWADPVLRERFTDARRKRVPALEHRLWAKVVKRKGKNACWEWIGKKNKWGYGTMRVPKGTSDRCHRISWELVNGSVGGLNVLHKCDNPCCVRPSHLFLGTQADNVRDMMQKGRRGYVDPRTAPKGEDHGRSKLTEPQIIELRKLYRPRRGVGLLAKRFGITRNQVSRIARGDNWKHVK